MKWLASWFTGGVARAVLVLGVVLISAAASLAAPQVPADTIQADPYAAPDILRPSTGGQGVVQASPTVSGAGGAVLYSQADALVMEELPDFSSGDSPVMYVGYDFMFGITRSLVWFDVATLPAGEEITEASLRLCYAGSWWPEEPGLEREIRTYRATSAWSEDEVTWNNQPGFGEQYGSNSIVTEEYLDEDCEWYEFDVTDLVRAWHQGTYLNYGIMILGPEIADDDAGAHVFATRESDHGPELVVAYNGTAPTPAPTVTSITPNSGENTGSVAVSIAGSGFESGASVKLTRAGYADINGTGVTVVSPSQITCNFNLVGRAAGAWNVVVTNPDTQSGALPNSFTITAPTSAPTVTSITPNSGENTGSVAVSIAGSGFESGASVKLTRAGYADINGTGVTVVSPSQITCNFNLTGRAAGGWNVVVTNPDTQSGALPNGFTITAPTLPEEPTRVYLPVVLRNAVPDAGFRIGRKTTTPFDLPPSEVGEIEAGGHTFRFPAGGTGELVTAPILRSPYEPYPGNGMYIEYAGASQAELILPGTDDWTDGYPMLYVWASVQGAFDDEIGPGKRWIALPYEKLSDGRMAFGLPPAVVGSAVDDAVATAVEGVSKLRAEADRPLHYWISRIEPGTDNMWRATYIDGQRDAYIEHFLDHLEPATRSAVQTRMDRVPLRLVYGGAYYTGFEYFTDLLYDFKPIIALPLDRSTGLINPAPLAHEMGHYFNHLLVGDDIYVSLERQGNPWPFGAYPTDHAMGDPVGRGALLEEYAYFIEYFLQDQVGPYDLHHPYELFGLLDLRPSEVDFPGVEGFSAFMLASLVRTDTQIKTYTGYEDPVPLIGLSYTDAFQIIAEGATNVDDLREKIFEKADHGRLAVMLQRLGWAYQAKGRLVDAQGDPVSGVTVKNIIEIGSDVYESGYALPPNAHGQFSLSDAFGGASKLRIRLADGQEVDLDIPPIDWSELTTTEIDLGDITVPDGDMVLVPAGEFSMGCDPHHNGGYPCGSRDLPLQTVYLDTYMIDRTPVTNAQYAQCVAAGGCVAPSQGSDRESRYSNPVYAHHPHFANWGEAAAYCTWAGKRLPTEAEWEKAARGPTVRAWPWGDQHPDCTLANFRYGEGEEEFCVGDTSRVGSYPAGASPYGALDMAGNVFEWVRDLWDQYDWSRYVVRGGSLGSRAVDIRTAARSSRLRDQYHVLGFRCARDSQ